MSQTLNLSQGITRALWRTTELLNLCISVGVCASWQLASIRGAVTAVSATSLQEGEERTYCQSKMPVAPRALLLSLGNIQPQSEVQSGGNRTNVWNRKWKVKLGAGEEGGKALQTHSTWLCFPTSQPPALLFLFNDFVSLVCLKGRNEILEADGVCTLAKIQ